ncbi:pentatricopeptide repeat-containing protein, mitochondrial [Iris pallida]|uniref:Pentatricopeptide repeat-containing protein, mitochondrial n=1 Tax=Iris pallida TaxID=29817 RepID=A0AAX6HRK9_IRIPA|nr:pentatricopeptide repeat-containing protein, mitochondrial [Iris pallida]
MRSPGAIAHARLVVSGSTNPSDYHHVITLYSGDSSSLLLFRRLPFPPKPASWTTVISAHSRRSPPLSLSLFLSLLRRGPLSLLSQGTLSCLLKTFALSNPSFGAQLHSLSLKLSISSQPFAGSALINFYSQHGLSGDALKLFDEMPDRDAVCYSAVVVGLAKNRRPTCSLSYFNLMLAEGVPSTMYSISGVLSAAAYLAGLELAEMIHAHVVVTGFEGNFVVGTALVDAYGKAGMVSDARRVFECLSREANKVTWNALISAYAQHGDFVEVGKLFEGMVAGGFVPDGLTFLAVLTAFSNAGMVGETERWLGLMGSRYGVEPGIEHYTCLVGAMARVGKLAEAEKLALEMPFEADAAVWRTLLTGCVVYRDVELGRRVGQRLLERNPQDDSTYVMLANIYSAAGRKNEMAGVWTLMRDRGVRKERGRSWIEVRGEVHVFIAGDRNHERIVEIYEKVRELREEVAKLGYEEEDEAIWSHGERLALAFGLISSSAMEGKVVRVVKNLRICKRCHDFFKIVSRVVGREIVVRDVNRYHRFVNGGCTCRDYW